LLLVGTECIRPLRISSQPSPGLDRGRINERNEDQNLPSERISADVCWSGSLDFAPRSWGTWDCYHRSSGARWSHDVYKPRKAGLSISTDYAVHKGDFPGRIVVTACCRRCYVMNFYQPRPPLTPVELARRAAALTATRSDDQEGDANAETVHSEPSDERQYGTKAAKILRDAKRGVALASNDAKLAVFHEAAAALAQAVASQWLPKNVMVDRLYEIATANGFFGRHRHDIEEAIGKYSENVPLPVKPVALPPLSSHPERPKRRLISHRASDLQPEKLVWVWPGRIPEGKLVLLGGPPGLGKSQLTAFMSAIVSNGGYWPCGEGSTIPGDVIFMSAEDGVQDTIIPRLMAAGADCERVHIVSAATKRDGTGRKTFSLKTDVDLLEDMAKKIGSVRLIIVDPISAYMGGSDGNGNVETREVLEPLADMANRLRIAVVAVTHLNKGGGGGNQSALNRFAGSIAFVAAARSAFAVIEDPEDDERRFLNHWMASS
jgi:hypothetical protein